MDEFTLFLIGKLHMHPRLLNSWPRPPPLSYGASSIWAKAHGQAMDELLETQNILCYASMIRFFHFSNLVSKIEYEKYLTSPPPFPN